MRLPACLLLAAAVVLTMHAHHDGIQRTADSWRYLAAARGNWLRLTHWPPAYPLALRLLGDVGANVAALAVTLSCVQAAGGWLAVLLCVSSATMATAHGLALSEPLFLALASSCLLACERRSPWAWPALALACLTRYVGVLLLPVVWLSDGAE